MNVPALPVLPAWALLYAAVQSRLPYTPTSGAGASPRSAPSCWAVVVSSSSAPGGGLRGASRSPPCAQRSPASRDRQFPARQPSPGRPEPNRARHHQVWCTTTRPAHTPEPTGPRRCPGCHRRPGCARRANRRAGPVAPVSVPRSGRRRTPGLRPQAALLRRLRSAVPPVRWRPPPLQARDRRRRVAAPGAEFTLTPGPRLPYQTDHRAGIVTAHRITQRCGLPDRTHHTCTRQKVPQVVDSDHLVGVRARRGRRGHSHPPGRVRHSHGHPHQQQRLRRHHRPAADPHPLHVRRAPMT